MDEIIRRILTASVYEVARETPLETHAALTQRLGRPVRLKREDLQPVFSFKLRGAWNRISRLSAGERARGVICASAGNHAQGVAASASRLGVRAVIVMPRTTPEIKIAAVRRLGGEVVIEGDTFDDARLHAEALCAREGLVPVHPFDDLDVIAGQGTIGVEILRQHPGPLAAIFIPVGGGGLAAGIASYVRALRPEVRLIGVEPEDAASMQAALRAGQPVALNEVGIFADGVAVRQVGVQTYRLCAQFLDRVVTVSTDEICAAMKEIFDHSRSIAEPAGALALAGLIRHAPELAGTEGAAVAVVSGGNVNFDRLRHVAERWEIGARAEALFGVTIPERPGAYRAFIRLLGERAITEFNYRIAPGADARIFVGVRLTEGEAERREILRTLSAAGLPVVDLTDNETAKLHLRYMVGGRVEGLADEVLYRFEFPERPGALARFLEGMRPDWNISLFHYRNHGSDYGRVLAGIQVPAAERGAFAEWLGDLGYPHWNVSDDPAYRLFLAGH